MQPVTRQRLIANFPAPRLQTYLNAAGQDPELAWDLYRWNIDAAAAVSGTLAIVEVAIRDIIDRKLREWNVLRGGTQEWVTSPVGILGHLVRPTPPPSWSPRHQGGLHGKWWEAKAKGAMKDHLGRPAKKAPNHDDLIAALTFGSWKFLLPKPIGLGGRTKGPRVQLWEEALNINSTVCAPGVGFNTSSGTAHYWMSLLIYARNRASHLEPMLDTAELSSWHRTASRMLNALWPESEALIAGPARIPRVIKKKPMSH